MDEMLSLREQDINLLQEKLETADQEIAEQAFKMDNYKKTVRERTN